jgi:hypothetical protein
MLFMAGTLGGKLESGLRIAVFVFDADFFALADFLGEATLVAVFFAVAFFAAVFFTGFFVAIFSLLSLIFTFFESVYFYSIYSAAIF